MTGYVASELNHPKEKKNVQKKKEERKSYAFHPPPDKHLRSKTQVEVRKKSLTSYNSVFKQPTQPQYP